jgi:hypothetical protein
MKYHVLLSRLVEQQCEVEVDAPDQEAAGDKALELDNVVELIWILNRDAEPHTLTVENISCVSARPKVKSLRLPQED